MRRFGSHTSSRTWTKPRSPEYDKWLQVEANLKRMELIPRSITILPTDFRAWVAQRQGRLQDQREEDARQIAAREKVSITFEDWAQHLQGNLRDPRDEAREMVEREARGRRRSRPVRIDTAFGRKRFDDGRGAVLCWPTFWSLWYRPTLSRPEALWPCREEMKEEGDERNTSGFRRFLGLPRVPGNETVVWKQKNLLYSLPFDEVWRLPTAESVAAAAALEIEAIKEEVEALIGKSLLSAIS